jgi:hypothetical protein
VRGWFMCVRKRCHCSVTYLMTVSLVNKLVAVVRENLVSSTPYWIKLLRMPTGLNLRLWIVCLNPTYSRMCVTIFLHCVVLWRCPPCKGRSSVPVSRNKCGTDSEK